MAIFTTKIELNNSKYYQLTGDTLSLSGTTNIGKAQYIKDVSSTYDDRSVIDKGYLDYRLLALSGSSSALISGATNGLTLSSKAVKLGGNLTNNTDIDTNNKIFRLGELSNFGPYLYIDPTNSELANFYNATDYSTIVTDNTLKSIELTTSVTGNTSSYILNQYGLQAANNYYSGNTNNLRWIPDKEYIDTKLSGTTNIFNNGLINTSGNTIQLGGSLIKDTNINLNSNNLSFSNGRVISSGATGLGFDSYSNYKLSGTTFMSTASGGFDAGNVAIGYQALNNNTSGCNNIANGYQVLLNNTTGNNNIAVGYQALNNNTEGSNNIANGNSTLYNNTTGCNNVAIGTATLFGNTTGCDNIANGNQALNSNTTGNYNIANGYFALLNNISGCDNIANGNSALLNNTTGNCNIANGNSALLNNTTGCNNIANGNSALYCNTEGSNNIANGNSALYSNSIGCDNIANGNSALLNNTTGCNNIANGISALIFNTTGCNNIANGNSALYCNISGCDNIANGYFALLFNTTGCNNIANGNQALNSNTTGCDNIANGIFALFGNTTGCDNISFGTATLFSNTTGCNNIAIGNSVLCNNIIGCNNIAIGNSALCSNDGCNNTALGFASLCTNLTGNNNIGLGFSAGKYETASNIIYIDNIDRTSLALGKTNSLLYGVTNLSPSAQTLTTNSIFTATYGVNIPISNTYSIGNNNIQNHYLETTVSGSTTLTGNEYVVYGDNSTLAYTINLPLNPIKGTAFKIKDVGGNASVNNIIISGNTRNINASTTSLINTNYGAVEIIYNINKNKWYTLSFAN